MIAGAKCCERGDVLIRQGERELFADAEALEQRDEWRLYHVQQLLLLQVISLLGLITLQFLTVAFTSLAGQIVGAHHLPSNRRLLLLLLLSSRRVHKVRSARRRDGATATGRLGQQVVESPSLVVLFGQSTQRAAAIRSRQQNLRQSLLELHRCAEHTWAFPTVL